MKLADTLLKSLSEAAGVSGAEDEVRNLILNEIKDHVSDIRIDTMGNVLALKKGTGAVNLRVLAAAHMDEVGFMVTGFESDGTIKIGAVGGIDNRLLPALRVLVGKKKIPGVITWKPIHLSWKEKDVKTLETLRVDIGASSKSAAEAKVGLGERVIFASETTELNGSTIRGKAFDDRAGCAQLIEICKGDPLPYDLLVAFTVQEEIGLRGARVLGESLRPDAAIILETTASHELPQSPDQPDTTTVTRLGHGPVIYHMDSGAISHPGLRKHFINTAQSANIPHQFRSPQYAGGTDAGAVQTSISGIPVLTVASPARYLHSPYLIMDLNDFSHGIKLISTALAELRPQHLERKSSERIN